MKLVHYIALDFTADFADFSLAISRIYVRLQFVQISYKNTTQSVIGVWGQLLVWLVVRGSGPARSIRLLVHISPFSDQSLSLYICIEGISIYLCPSSVPSTTCSELTYTVSFLNPVVSLQMNLTIKLIT